MNANESNMYWLGYYHTHKPELAMLVYSLEKLKLALDKGFEPHISPQAIREELCCGYNHKLLKLDRDLMYFLYTN